MNKAIFSIGLIFSLFLSLSSYAQETETRSLGSFDAIKTSEGIHVIARKGNRNEARITARNIDLSDVVTEISNGKLKFELDGSNHRNVTVEIELTYSASSFDYLAASSGSSLDMKDDIQADDLEIESSSAGSVKVEGSIRTRVLDARSSSSGQIKINHVTATTVDAKSSSAGGIKINGGRTTELEAEASSAGTINCAEMSAQEVDAHASSGGGAKIHAAERLSANASSGGWIKYKGSPNSPRIRKSSGGSVKSM